MADSGLIDIMKSRRSCRKYSDEPVSREIIDKIIEAGTFAATGRNFQSPVIFAVLNKGLRDKISKLNAEVIGSENDPFYGAPQVLIVLADSKIPTCLYDGSLVMGNMMNAAEALGVSSCWIHRAKEVFESEEGSAILREYGIPDSYQGIGNLIIGYDDNGKRDKSPRKPNYVIYAE